MPTVDKKDTSMEADEEDLEVANELGNLEDPDQVERNAQPSSTTPKCSPGQGAIKVSMWCDDLLKDLPTLEEQKTHFDKGVKKLNCAVPKVVDNMESHPLSFVDKMASFMDAGRANSLHREFGCARELMLGALRIACKKKVDLFPLHGLTQAMMKAMSKCLLRVVCMSKLFFAILLTRISSFSVGFDVISVYKKPYRVALEDNESVYKMMLIFLDSVFDEFFGNNKQDLSVQGVFPQLVADLIGREGNQIAVYPDKDPDKTGKQKFHLGARGALILAAFAGIVSNNIYRENVARGFLEALKEAEKWKKAFYAVGIVTFGMCMEDEVSCGGKEKVFVKFAVCGRLQIFLLLPRYYLGRM